MRGYLDDEADAKFSSLLCFFSLNAEIPLYHILNARITFSNLNGCEEGTGVRADNEVGVEGDGQRDAPRTDTPSPGSDSSSVSSSSSTSKNTHATVFSVVLQSHLLSHLLLQLIK